MYTYVVQNPWTYYDPQGLAAARTGWRNKGAEQFNKNGGWGTVAAGAAAGVVRGVVDTASIAVQTSAAAKLDNAVSAVTGQAPLSQSVDNFAGALNEQVSQTTADVTGTDRNSPNFKGGELAGELAAPGGVAGKTASKLNKAGKAVTEITESARKTLGEGALKNVSDDSLVHFTQAENKVSVAEKGVSSNGGVSSFFKAEDVKPLTVNQVKGAIGDLAQGGKDIGAAAVVSPKAAKFDQVTTQGMKNFVTDKPSVKVEKVVDVDKD